MSSAAVEELGQVKYTILIHFLMKFERRVFFMQAGLIVTICIVLMLDLDVLMFVCEPISLLISAVAYFGTSGGNKVDSFPKLLNSTKIISNTSSSLRLTESKHIN